MVHDFVNRYVGSKLVVLVLLSMMMSFTAVNASAESNPSYTNCGLLASYSATYWTPIILLNSPYGGSGTAQSTVSYTGEYTIDGTTSYTSSTYGISISDSNGGATGYFEKDTWTRYHYAFCPDVTEITYHSGNDITYDLLPQNSMSEDNELHNFTDYGIPSLYFTNQYTTNNDGSQSTCNGQGFSITITTTSTTSISIQMSFAGGEYVSVGEFDIGISGSQSNTNSFTYTFPGFFGTWYLDSLNGQSQSNQGALGFLYQQCSGGGGGGCVLGNTMIMLANGTSVPVKALKDGDMVKAYDLSTHEMVDTKVTSNMAKQVDQIIEINGGELFVSGLTDQPMYVQLQNGSIGHIELGQLKSGMKLFNPISNSWIYVTSAQLINGQFTVYDLRTTSGDYIANGFVILVK